MLAFRGMRTWGHSFEPLRLQRAFARIARHILELWLTYRQNCVVKISIVGEA